MKPDLRRGAVHALVDFVEQYRQTKDIYLQKIEKRSTSVEQPTDEYKEAYKTFMGRVFDHATNVKLSDDVSFDLDHLSKDELRKMGDRYPLFPNGTRLKHVRDEEKKEDDRLFGTPEWKPTGKEYELKTVNLANKSPPNFTTHHHMNRMIVAKYRFVH